MKINIRLKLLFFSFIILVGIGYIGYTEYKSNQELLDSIHWVQHTEQVIHQSADILARVKDIEIASQGFLISGDSLFLKSDGSPKSIFAMIGNLRQLTWDNHLQELHEDSLTVYMHNYVDFSSQIVGLRNKKGLSPAGNSIYIEEGRNLVASVTR